MRYIPRAFWTVLILASMTLTAAYAVPSPSRGFAVPLLVMLTFGCVIIPFFFQPICLFILAMVAFTATPAGWMLGDIERSGHGLSPEQVAVMLAMLTSTLLAPRAWPMWDGNGNQRDMGPWPFTAVPIIVGAFAFAAYSAGANGYFALALVAAAMVWNLAHGLWLDLALWQRQQDAIAPQPDACSSG